MKAEAFPEANTVLSAPPGLPEGACYDLPIHRHSRGVISCWRPTADDLVRLNLGGPIYLMVEGATHPPLLLLTESPFMPLQPDDLRAEAISNGAQHCGNCGHFQRAAAAVEGVCQRWLKTSVFHHECDQHQPTRT